METRIIEMASLERYHFRGESVGVVRVYFSGGALALHVCCLASSKLDDLVVIIAAATIIYLIVSKVVAGVGVKVSLGMD